MTDDEKQELAAWHHSLLNEARVIMDRIIMDRPISKQFCIDLSGSLENVAERIKRKLK